MEKKQDMPTETRDEKEDMKGSSFSLSKHYQTEEKFKREELRTVIKRKVTAGTSRPLIFPPLPLPVPSLLPLASLSCLDSACMTMRAVNWHLQDATALLRDRVFSRNITPDVITLD